MLAYLVEVGVLQPKTNDVYSIVYDKQFNYYDENQYYSLDYDKAIKEVEEYVKNGVNQTYGIISKTTLNEDYVREIGIENLTVEYEDYLTKNILYDIMKDVNGNIHTNFILKEHDKEEKEIEYEY